MKLKSFKEKSGPATSTDPRPKRLSKKAKLITLVIVLIAVGTGVYIAFKPTLKKSGSGQDHPVSPLDSQPMITPPTYDDTQHQLEDKPKVPAPIYPRT